jgi:hypothetical protein
MWMTKRLGWCTVAAALIAAAPVMAGQADEASAEATEQAETAAPQVGKYRIGLGCVPVPESLRVQLRLPEGHGLLVQQVLDGTPAAKAGVEKYDFILQADGAELQDVMDLVRAVDRSEGKETTLKVVRGGEERQIRVNPEPRPQDEDGIAGRSEEFEVEMLPEEARQWLEGFGGPRGGALNWRQFRPGIVIEDLDKDGRWDRRIMRRELPENFSLQIEKKDNSPAKIHVRRGSDEWDVTEDDLQPLPEDVRVLVEDMLGESRGNVSGWFFPNRPEGPGMRLAPRPLAPDGSRLEQRLDEMSLKLKELQEAIESLRSPK